MLVLVTGNPGSGKTLWTLPEVLALEEKWKEQGKDRPVYYNGIKLKPAFPGIERWQELSDQEMQNPHGYPVGSIFVVDECYRLWEAPRKSGVHQPDFIEKFATHRHRGHDFYLICQKPSQLHHFVRDLIGRHVHFEAPFGLPRARRFEWQKLADVTDHFEKKAAISDEFWYPKKVYDWYQSADLHTKKNRLPWLRLGGIAFLVAAVAFAGWSVFDNFASKTKKAPASSPVQSVPASNLAQAVSSSSPAVWGSRFVERVPGVPFSAPFFDSKYVAASVPKISGCLSLRFKDRTVCKCNTQQGTVITSMSVTQCEFYVANGWFDPTLPDSAARSGSGQGSGAPAGVPAGQSLFSAP